MVKMYELFQMIWHRSENGYAWREGPFSVRFGLNLETLEGAALVPIGESEIAYQPKPDLFLEFASLDLDSDPTILAFANQYGLLGGGPLWLKPEANHKGERVAGVKGEVRSYWQEHLRDMKAAVSLWQAINFEDQTVLEQCIRWRSAKHVTYEWPPSSDWSTPWSIHATIASPSQPEILKRLKPGDVVMPARMYLQELANTRLKQFVASRLLWNSPDRNRMGLYIAPDTLIGCLWLQLATAIAEFRKFRLCESCRKPMLIAPEGSGYRTNRKTCSNACRIRVYERRKKEARRLRVNKISVREIAKRLNTGVEQVKRWIA